MKYTLFALLIALSKFGWAEVYDPNFPCRLDHMGSGHREDGAYQGTGINITKGKASDRRHCVNMCAQFATPKNAPNSICSFEGTAIVLYWKEANLGASPLRSETTDYYDKCLINFADTSLDIETVRGSHISSSAIRDIRKCAAYCDPIGIAHSRKEKKPVWCLFNGRLIRKYNS